MSDDHQPTYRWYMLALVTATGAFVATIPFSCLPVLFDEIAEDLGLNLVQVGTIWGMANLAGIFVTLISGMLGDRFGVKLVVGLSCLLVGITGALRGLADTFLTLTVTVFINGIVRLIIPVNVNKAIGIWFKGQKLGMAMGIASMGIGFGLMLGPLISATILSPLLGGWRNVMYLYGAVSAVVGILWFLFGREYSQVAATTGQSAVVPIRQSLSRLIRIKSLWFIGLTLMLRAGCIMGMTGYLPLYLREQGWVAASADGTLSVFYAVSTACVVLLCSLSDRLGSRKVILFPALIMTIICFGLLPAVEGITIWVLIILSGIFLDGFMAIINTMLLETDGVGPVHSGTALGIVFTMAHIGGIVSPPLGNSLASIDSGLPFVFWASLCVVALVTLTFSKETGGKGVKALGVEHDTHL